GNFTLANYIRFLSSPFYLRVLGKTIYLAAITTALCGVFGSILAMAIWRAPARWRGAIIIVVISPLLVSIVTRTFGWMIVLGVTIVFSLAMSSYITPALMGGPDSGMITTLIYQQFVVTFNWQFGAVLVAILLAVSLVLVGATLFEFGRRTRKWMVRR